MKMNPLGFVLQRGLLTQPWFWGLALVRLGLAVAFVAAIVFAAWKIGSYYSAAGKKL